jgi:glucokinase
MSAQTVGGGTFAVGVDIGGTTIKAGAVTTGGVVSGEVVVPSRAEEGPEEVLSQAAGAVRSVLSATGGGGGTCTGVGVGIPGIVSTADGLVRYPPNFQDWAEVDVSGELARRTGMRVRTENDANTAALAEAKFGAGVNHRDFVFVIWGTGVGGGLILDGKIFRGPGGGAGEIGHVTIDRQGPPCNCGNRGCVEAYIGQKYLSQRTAKLVGGKDAAAEGSVMMKLAGGDLSTLDPAMISRAAELGDEAATRVLTEAGAMLGVALASVVNVVDIPTVIIGGGISAAPEFVFRAAADEMRARVLRPHRDAVSVSRALLGNTAGVIGAASLLF